MHEMSLAMNIVDLAVSKAELAGGKKIDEIELSVGTLAGVLIDSLAFCFDAVVKGTLADGARLKIVEKQGKGRCRKCDAVFQIDSFFAQCPECGEYQVDVIEGKDLRVISITIDE